MKPDKLASIADDKITEQLLGLHCRRQLIERRIERERNGTRRRLPSVMGSHPSTELVIRPAGTIVEEDWLLSSDIGLLREETSRIQRDFAAIRREMDARRENGRMLPDLLSEITNGENDMRTTLRWLSNPTLRALTLRVSLRVQEIRETLACLLSAWIRRNEIDREANEEALREENGFLKKEETLLALLENEVHRRRELET